MASLTDYAENKLTDWLFRGQSLTPPTNWHFMLLTTAANEAGSLVEVSGGGYARVSVAASLTNFAGTQAAGSTTASTGNSGTTSNNIAITFPTPTADWGSIVAVAVADAATGGNVWIKELLAASKTVNNGDPAPAFPIGAFTFQIDN